MSSTRGPAMARSSAFWLSASRASLSAISSWRGPASGQLERLLVDGQLGLGLIQGGLGVIEILLAHRLDLRLVGEADRREALEAIVPATSVDDLGLSRHDVGSGLRDLFGSAAVAELLDDRLLGRGLRSSLRDLFGSIAVAQPLHNLPLGGELGGGLRNLRLQTTPVQPGQHLTAPNAVPFLGQDRGNSLAVVERELDLPQVDVPVERQRLGDSLRTVPPPPGADAAPMTTSNPTTTVRLMQQPRSWDGSAPRPSSTTHQSWTGKEGLRRR